MHNDLKEAAKEYAKPFTDEADSDEVARLAFIRGAQWQHERDIALFELPGCSGPQYYFGEDGDEVGFTFRVMQIIADCIRAHRTAHYKSEEDL